MADPITILTIGGSVLSGIGTIMGGRAEDAAAKSQAAQMQQQAGQERATAQREAIERRRQANLAISRARAVGGASGAAVSDIAGIEGDIAAEGDYNARTALFEGEDRAVGLEYGARVTRAKGKAAKKSAMIGGIAQVASGVGSAYYQNSMLEKYSPKGVQ
jgi:hypothetical protein